MDPTSVIRNSEIAHSNIEYPKSKINTILHPDSENIVKKNVDTISRFLFRTNNILFIFNMEFSNAINPCR